MRRKEEDQMFNMQKADSSHSCAWNKIFEESSSQVPKKAQNWWQIENSEPRLNESIQ